MRLKVLLVLMLLASPAAAQQVIWDNAVRAGELQLFRDFHDEKVYYYAPTNARLATGADGQPDFSFFRWVETRAGSGSQAEGGGIIVAQVTFGATPEMLADAQNQLARLRPGAKIAGPIVPKKATFALVSTAADPKNPKNQFSTQVLGVGTAPILEGQKAAVSIMLTPLGAKVLWEQFQTTRPDLAFAFDMLADGYSGPIRASVEANLDEVMKHDAFSVGAAGNFFGAEISGVFDQLRAKNVIKVTRMEGDEEFNSAIDAAYQQLVQVLFDKASNESAPTMPTSSSGATDPNAESWLSRATAMYSANKKSEEEVRAENDQIKSRNAERRKLRDEAAAIQKRVRDLEIKIRTAESAASRPARPAAGGAAPTAPPERQPTPTSESGQTEGTAGAGTSGAGTSGAATGGAATADAASATPGTPTTPPDPATTTPPPATTTTSAAAPADTSDLRAQLTTAKTELTKKEKELQAKGPEESLRSAGAQPGFAILGSYKMKRSRKTGEYRVELNRHRASERNFHFSENVGDLRPLLKTGAFRQVNIDDPLYRQREIVAYLDIDNTNDFGQYVNFVSLRLRKKHESGELTDEEVRIDRKNFNQEGNHFKMVYGWKGDNNRQRWMDYEYQTVWSFFGGHTMEMPWVKASANAITLAPPLQRRSVQVQGDAKALTEQGVKAITVKVFYRADKGAPEQVKQVTLNPAKENFVGKVDFVGPKDSVDYDFEIAWRLAGNKTVTTGRQTTSSEILDVGDMPKTSS